MFAKKFTSLMLRNASICKYHNARNFSVTSANREIIKIQSTEDFKKKVINSKVPVVVDFYATWCNPCKLLTPRIESVVSENIGKVILAKVDIDEQTDLALDYDVSSVPVLLSIKNGKVQQRVVGLQDTDNLRKFVEHVVRPETEVKEAKV